MYRETGKARKYRLMREKKARDRLESDAPDYPLELPDRRKTIIITNYDFGEEVHKFELFKARCIDQYRVTVNDELWHKEIGMTRIFEGMRKAMPPIRAI